MADWWSHSFSLLGGENETVYMQMLGGCCFLFFFEGTTLTVYYCVWMSYLFKFRLDADLQGLT